MKIKFSGLLKTDVTGEWETEVSASDISDLLAKLISKYGAQFEEKVLVDGMFKWNILVLLNGTLITQVDILRKTSEGNLSRDIMNRELSESDIVSIFELVCG